MRAIPLTLATLLLPSAALAADYSAPIYAPPVVSRIHDWSGTYIGAQGGFTQAKINSWDFVSITDPTGLNASFNAPLGSGSADGGSYGAFIGFNGQWEDIVLGVEFTYNRFGTSNSFSYSFSQMYILNPVVGPELVNVTATTAARITDLFGGRVRAGWATSWVMPYATLGVVVARGDTSSVVSINGIPTVPVGSTSTAWTTNSATPFGFSAGLGIDMAITSNLFARAEIEYVGLRESKGVGGQLTTYRAGLGYKF